MRDKKFAIAVAVIIVLALILVYVIVVSPKIQGYVTSQQVQGYNIAINNLVQTVNNQGVAQIPNGENKMIVCQNIDLQQVQTGEWE